MPFGAAFLDQTDKNAIIDLGACLKEWENLESYREDDSILKRCKDTDERMKLMHQVALTISKNTGNFKRGL